MGRETKKQLKALGRSIQFLCDGHADLRNHIWELEHPKDGNARKPEAAPIYTPVEVLKCHLRALKSGEIFEQSWSEEHVAPALEALLAEHKAFGRYLDKYDVGSKTCGLTDEFRVAIVAHDAVEVPDDARS